MTTLSAPAVLTDHPGDSNSPAAVGLTQDPSARNRDPLSLKIVSASDNTSLRMGGKATTGA
jgi:hypothetical protein